MKSLTFGELVLIGDFAAGHVSCRFGHHHAADVGPVHSDRLHGAIFIPGVKHHIAVDLWAKNTEEKNTGLDSRNFSKNNMFCFFKCPFKRLTSANRKAASNGKQICPCLMAWTEAGPHLYMPLQIREDYQLPVLMKQDFNSCYYYYLPSLVSCGVASTTCQPPKPAGRSGLDMKHSFQQ